MQRRRRSGSWTSHWRRDDSIWYRVGASNSDMNVDHRFTQTQHPYAADDLETMSEAKRYQDHVFQLLRPFIGRSVLEVGCGIGTTSLRLPPDPERPGSLEPHPQRVARA